MYQQPVILNIMPFVFVCFSPSFTMMLSSFSEPNSRRVDIGFRVPDKRPLFNETIQLLQCMVLCVSMPSCLSVLYQMEKPAKDTNLHIANRTTVSVFRRGNIFLQRQCFRDICIHIKHGFTVQNTLIPVCLSGENTCSGIIARKKCDICYIVFLIIIVV